MALLALCFATGASASCEDLANFPMTDGKITGAVSVAEKSTVPLALMRAALVAPADFCRISVTLNPSADSEIMAEVWLPDPTKWNGKYFGVGNGGFGGTVIGPMLDMRRGLAKGYATAGNDLGHEVTSMIPDGSWVIGHPEKVKDFAYRADHVMAEFAKKLIAVYYGRGPQLSYFRGCSNGGHEALMEAQRYPTDYDGIIAGAPANAWTHIMVGFLWNETAQFATPGSQIPHDKLASIQKAVLAKCDALDGVKDGVINDPAKCRFDPKELLCKSGDSPECLTQPQVDALNKIYVGPIDPKTHRSLYPGFPPGSEGLASNWDTWITNQPSAQSLFGNQFYGAFVLGEPKWDYRTFDFATDPAKTDAVWGPVINSNDPDLSAFAKHGGKLILYQGWADAAITPWGTIQYYESIRQKMGADAAHRFVRLFMAPGMMHCGGGPGPSDFDSLAAMEQWREQSQAPETMIASRYVPNPAAALTGDTGPALATRPLCAYPKVAYWNGKDSPDEAKNYACR
jgi:feruloyl esterase